METNERIIESKIGILTVKSYVGKKKMPAGDLRDFYGCECECGKYTEVDARNLHRTHTKSCGCLKRKQGSKNKGWLGCGELSGRDWNMIKSKADQRDIAAWNQFQKQDGKCALTGWQLSLKSIKGNYSDKTASLDRIDSKKGYETNNIQWLHKDVNLMKSFFSDERFVEVCKAVAEFKKDLNEQR